MSRNVLTPDEFLKRIMSQEVGSRASYKACYMSWVDGFVTDPRLMLIGLDDHMVHRGDGVFEAVKVVKGKAYLLKEHLDRLEKSSELIALALPLPRQEFEAKVQETLELSKLDSAIMRIFVSRGTGSFSPNPYDSKQSGLAIVATEMKPISQEKYLKGARVGKSHLPPKPGVWAQIKSCNYLPNVLMKKESVDRGLDFTVSFDESGYLCESSTENMIVVDEKGRLCRPYLDRILKGCTMTRVMDLARDEKSLQDIGEQHISMEMILKAREVMMVGTTLDVLPVTEFEGQKIGGGLPGPIAKKLQTMLLNDQM